MEKIILSFCKISSYKINFLGILIPLIFLIQISNAQGYSRNNKGSTTSQSIRVNAGWNLMSLPLTATDNRKNSLFPTAISQAFIYQKSYQPKDTLQTGLGFWLKFDSSETILISGEPVYEDTTTVRVGWNMIGSLTVPVAVNQIVTEPAGIITSDYFSYNSRYKIADTLKPGAGYWVKVHQDGAILYYSIPPKMPANPNPTDGSTGHPKDVTLSWICRALSGDLLTYDVYFGIDNPPAAKVSSNQTSESFAEHNLTLGTTYYWKIVSRDNHGDSTNGPVWRFTTNHPPNAPSDPNPADLSTGQPANVILNWTSGDPDGDALTYDVYFGSDNPPATKVSSNQTSASFSKNNLTLGTTYYWKVVSRDIHGDSTNGPVWRFTTNHPPNAPSSPIPADNSMEQPANVTLNWTCSDPDGDALTYDIYFGTDNPPATKVSSNQSSSSLAENNLTSGTTYYWEVVSKDIHGGSASGPVWRFKINNPPGIPANINPPDNSVGLRLSDTLRWSSIDIDGDPLTYDVYFGTDNPPASIIASNLADTNLIQNDLSSGTTYHWKIVAKDNRGGSTESPVWEFTTMGAACPGMATVDYSGTTYNTVQIGGQCWLKENLNVGTMIDRLLDQTDNSVIEKYCYDNDNANCSLYGGLYQWNEAMKYVVSPGAQGICPTGWHIPTQPEVIYLRTFVDSNGNALKAIGQGTGAGTGTNTTGFSALIGGYRYPDGFFYDQGAYTAFWSSTEDDPDVLVTRFPLESETSDINLVTSTKDYGFNIRCLKD